MSTVNESVNAWSVFGESVRGASHTSKNLPNQDAIFWQCNETDGFPLIMAISDGHGSEKYFRSDQGARFAVALAVEELTQFAQAFSGPVTNIPLFTYLVEQLPQKIVEKWQTRVRDHLAESPFFTREEWQRYGNGTTIPQTTRNPLLPYGATLLAALVTKNFLLYLQLGDGDIVQVTEAAVASKPVKGDERLLANETTSLCSATAVQDFRIYYEHFVEAPPMLIFLSTDGYANSFADETNFLQVGVDILEQIRAHGLEQVKNNLHEWLCAATEQGSGDDITLGILYRAPSTSPQPSVNDDVQQISRDDDREEKQEPALTTTAGAIPEQQAVLPVLVVSSQAGDGVFASIQEALVAAQAHARIEVHPGVYREQLLIDKDIELVGMNEQGAVVIETPGISIRTGRAQLHNLTIRRKSSILNLFRPAHVVVEITAGCSLLHRCEIVGGSIGLCIRGTMTAPVVQECHIHGHTHTGILFTDNALGQVVESRIMANKRHNIAILNGSNPSIRSCTIEGGGGSGIHISSGATGRIDGCEIVDNQGAGLLIERAGNPTVLGCPQIARNRGSGLRFVRHGGGTIMECNIATNSPSNVSINSLSYPHIQHCRLQDADGPGILIDGQGKGGGGLIEHCDISGHLAETILIRNASQPFIRSCLIHEGVLLQRRGHARIENSTIVANGHHCVQVHDKGSYLSMSETEVQQQSDETSAIAFRDGSAGQLQQCKVTTQSATGISLHHNAALYLRRCRVESGLHALDVQRSSAASIEGGTYRSQQHGKKAEAISWDESSSVLEIPSLS